MRKVGAVAQFYSFLEPLGRHPLQTDEPLGYRLLYVLQRLLCRIKRETTKEQRDCFIQHIITGVDSISTATHLTVEAIHFAMACFTPVSQGQPAPRINEKCHHLSKAP